MSVVATSPVAVTDPTTDVNQLWALAYLFACDWSNGIKIRQSFQTDVVKSKSDCEQRRALVQSPARTIEVDLQIRGAEQIGLFRSFLMRATNCRFLVPLYSEEVVIVGESGGTTLTSARQFSDTRFVVGGRCALVGYGADGYYSSLSSFIASAVSGFTITGSGFTTADIGKSLFPLIECELILDQSATIITDQLLRASLVFVEARGDSSLDSMAAIGTNPLGVTATPGSTTYPVLTIDPDFAGDNKLGVQRAGETVVSGRGIISQNFGSRGRFRYDLSYAQLNRTSAMNLIKHFEAMGGRCKAFWLLSPCTDFVAVSFTGTTVVVRSPNLVVLDWTFYPYIGVKVLDGTIQIRAIVGTPTLSGSNWTITVAAWTVTPTLATIQRLSIANLVRFDSDEMEENWITDGVMSTSLKMVELPLEKALTISNIKDWTQGYS